MATLQQLISDIQTEFPYSTATFTDAWVCRKMNEWQNTIWRYQATTEVYEFVTSSGIAIYGFSSDMAIDMIKKVMVCVTTNSTDSYQTYSFAGMDDELVGDQFYDALGSIGLYPVPDNSGQNVKIFYENKPVTLTTNILSNSPTLNVEYHDGYKWAVKELIAKSGNAPDVELANNFTAEKLEVEKKMRVDYTKRKAKNPRETYPRSQHWWNG